MSESFNKQAIFWNTASQIVVRFVALAFTLVSIKLLASYLGPDGVGNYNTITTYINFFIVIADLGLFSVTVREIAKNPAGERKIIANVFTIRFYSALIASLIAILIVVLANYNFNLVFGVMIATGFLFFNLLGSVYDMILQYRLKMQYSALAELLSKLIAILALYSIIRNHGSFLAIMSTVAITGIGIFFFKWLFGRRFVAVKPQYDAPTINWILGIAWPLGLVFIIGNLFFKLDTLMLFAIKGATAVGIYSVAYKILEVTAFLGAYFASALKPGIAQNIAANKPYVGEIISRSINVMLFISLPITVISMVYAKNIILFLSTPSFLSGSPALVLLSLTLPLIYLDTLLVEILIANDERKLLIRIACFILIFNLVMNLIFVPIFSFMGAAFTTLLSELVLLTIDLHYTKKIVNYTINYRALLKTTLAAILTLIFASILKLTGAHFLILVALSLLAYFALATSLKIIGLGSLKELLSSK